MPIDRNIWLKPFTDSSVHPFHCPVCKVGVLTMKKDTGKNGARDLLVESSTPKAEAEMRKPGWYPLDDEGLFACILTCLRPQCREIVTVCGRSAGDLAYAEDGEYYVTAFSPLFFFPAPEVFRLPENCPPEIQKEVRSAFSLYWCDPSSCVNRIRTAVELFLTDLGIKRYKRAKGQLRRLSLHERIVLLQGQDTDLAESLMATKWLGNAGSHPGEMSREDALDGFDLLEHALEGHYAPRQKAICKIRKNINKRRKPRSIK
jgi:hypothetical protein